MFLILRVAWIIGSAGGSRAREGCREGDWVVGIGRGVGAGTLGVAVRGGGFAEYEELDEEEEKDADGELAEDESLGEREPEGGYQLFAFLYTWGFCRGCVRDEALRF